MKQLIAIGFWNDGTDDCPLRNPQEFVDPAWGAVEREEVFHYLRSGAEVAQYLGLSWCRFACGIDDGEMGSADLTDGVWIWPEGLAHYVARHEVRLPDEFLENARANRFRIPPVAFDEAPVGDATFWLEWCEAHTNGDPEAQALWRRTAEEIQQAEREIIEKLTLKHGGLSDETCAWAGCEHRALLGLAFCPACAHHRMNHWP